MMIRKNVDLMILPQDRSFYDLYKWLRRVQDVPAGAIGLRRRMPSVNRIWSKCQVNVITLMYQQESHVLKTVW